MKTTQVICFSTFCVFTLLVVLMFLEIGFPGVEQTPVKSLYSRNDGRTWQSPPVQVLTAVHNKDAALHVRRRMLRKVTVPRAIELGLTRETGNATLNESKAEPVQQDVKLPQRLVTGGADQQRAVKIVSDNDDGVKLQNRMIDIAGAPATLKYDSIIEAQADVSKVAMALSPRDYYYEDIDIMHDTVIESRDATVDDIDARSKWQMAQVDKFCIKYQMQSLNFTLPKPNSRARFNLYRHVLFDDQRQLIFTYIPKIGCTNTRRFMFVLTGALPLETIDWNNVHEKYLGPAVQQSSFVNPSLTDIQRLEKLAKYWKFTMLRNPLERLVSAFRNKLEGPLKFAEIYNQTFQMIKRSILEKYDPDTYKKWHNSKGSFELTLNFQTYIRWIIDTPNHQLNEHFSPMIHVCQPCRVKYNFYGNFKDFSSDMHLAMKKLQIPSQYFHDSSYHDSNKETAAYLHDYYSTLSSDTKAVLFKNFYAEFDFYYHLFPDDRGSSIELLQINFES